MQKGKKHQILYLPILSYFSYVIFKCVPLPKMKKKKTQKTFVLQFGLG